jgi:hypothetical protein
MLLVSRGVVDGCVPNGVAGEIGRVWASRTVRG